VAPEREWQSAIAAALPVLPAERRARVAEAAGVEPADAAVVVALDLDALVLNAIAAGANPKTALNRAENEVAAKIDRATSLDADAFARLCVMEAKGDLTATQAKTVLAEMLDNGGDPEKIAKDKGFEAMSADALAAAVDEVIAANPGDWADYCAGNDKVGGKFVGQVMKATANRANGGAVTAMLRERRSSHV